MQLLAMKSTTIRVLWRFFWFAEILLFVAMTRTPTTFADNQPKGGDNNGCTAVKLAWGSRGLETSYVSSSTTKGEHLQVCSRSSTCCTAEMESKMLLLGRQDFNRTVMSKIGAVRDNFVSQTSKYDGFCSELIDKASRDLHEMFVKTYGVLYEQNSKIFAELFQNLKLYYKGRALNLDDVLDSFFSALMQQMFRLLNANYVFDGRYLQCITDQMDQLQPFGDVPGKLSSQVRRAFIGARTFHQGLAIGREVMTAVSKLNASQSCIKAVAKLLWCPYCRGLTHPRPCGGFCLNVMRGCLAEHYELQEAWSTYVEWLTKLAERLEGPFNIESVVDPIDVKISDAIMNFQEKNEEVSKKVFLGCGQPSLAARAKRQTDDNDDVNFDWKPSGRQGQGQGRSPPVTAAGTSIDRLMREFREKLAPLKDLWRDLPHSVCRNFTAPENAQCWNGSNKSRYTQPLVADGLANQGSNPEVVVDIRKSNSVVEQQSLQLKMITEKLKKAFGGHDVDYYDIREPGGASRLSSGSGDDLGHSGSGFGDAVHGDIGFSFSIGPTVSVKTLRPYISSHPHSREKSRTNGRINAPASAARPCGLLWSTVLYFVAIVVLRNICQ